MTAHSSRPLHVPAGFPCSQIHPAQPVTIPELQFKVGFRGALPRSAHRGIISEYCRFSVEALRRSANHRAVETLI